MLALMLLLLVLIYNPKTLFVCIMSAVVSNVGDAPAVGRLRVQ